MIRNWLRSFTSKTSLRKIDLLVRHCNLHCPMCSMNANSQEHSQILRDYPQASPGPELTLEEYQQAFRSLKGVKPIVSIGGGEPMVFQQMAELLTFLTKEMGFPTGLTTNGTLFNRERITAIAETRAGITVSIDGMEEVHNRIRGEGVFRQATELLREMKKLKKTGLYQGNIYSLFAFHPENYEETLKVAHFLFEDIGIEALTVSFLVFSTSEILEKHQRWVQARGLPPSFEIHIARGGVVDSDYLAKMDFSKIWELKLKAKIHYPKIRFEPDFKSLEDLKRYFLSDEWMPEYFNRYCRPAHQELALLSNGDILFFPGCFQIKLGNIREKPLLHIWNGELLKTIRRVLASDLPPICSHCCGNRIEKKV